MTSFNPIQHHIVRSHESTRLCDGQPAGDADISGTDLDALREARSRATLCPSCQQDLGQPAVLLRIQRYRNSDLTLAHLYTVPVQDDFDAIRNCAHCREILGKETAGHGRMPERGSRSCIRRPDESPGTSRKWPTQPAVSLGISTSSWTTPWPTSHWMPRHGGRLRSSRMRHWRGPGRFSTTEELRAARQAGRGPIGRYPNQRDCSKRGRTKPPITTPDATKQLRTAHHPIEPRGIVLAVPSKHGNSPKGKAMTEMNADERMGRLEADLGAINQRVDGLDQSMENFRGGVSPGSTSPTPRSTDSAGTS